MTGSLDRTPCTIVTGFLGAGKTTLIRHLLQRAAGKRLALIVNEFGELGIDGQILKSCGIESCPEENVVELANGCICCTVAEDFLPALDRILALEPRVDHILIETSGLALPKPLVQAFQWPLVKTRVTVDGVVAVVDGAALAEGRVADDVDAVKAQRVADPSVDHDDPVEEVFADQVACADLIVLTKHDLLDEEQVARAKALVGKHLSRAVKIVLSAHGKLEPSVLLGLGLSTEDDIDNRKTIHDDETDHEHDEFESFVVELPPVAHPDDLAQRVKAATALGDVLRLKGFAHVAGKPMRLLVQAVGRRVSHYYDRPWATGEEPRTRLVVIGLKGIDRGKIAAALSA